MRSELDLYRQQHQEILAVAAELRAVGRPSISTAVGAGEARARLAELSGKLVFHLHMEDQRLYPDLLRSDRPEVRETAARFRSEMGSLRAEAEGAFRRWLRPAAIERAPDEFLREMGELLHALAERVAAEDAELYALADGGR